MRRRLLGESYRKNLRIMFFGTCGDVAKAAHVQRLVLTHIPPLVDRAREQVLRSIQAQTETPTSFAEDKIRIAP
jgi:ribonuclease BN (tRNA processing enzyme)